MLRYLAATSALAGLFLLAHCPAQAHDSWIGRDNFEDPVYGWRCCGEHDCTPYEPSRIPWTRSGYVVPEGEIIPFRRVIPSEDEHAYVCRWGSPSGDNPTKVRCLFIPQPGT